ncbi:hypothetical protein MLD38_036938 [Melastoma candidum]|uniref:Uncharacterized protein n=1 Tax=Melastoma candidum TaxID=119954 RepID=A0ACB9LL68_9MYRT|nr:hypothetical protein MLD38_036938 [Melastoma candidum]
MCSDPQKGSSCNKSLEVSFTSSAWKSTGSYFSISSLAGIPRAIPSDLALWNWRRLTKNTEISRHYLLIRESLPLPYDDKPRNYIARLLQISPAVVPSLFTAEGHISVNKLFELRNTPYEPHMGDGQGSARAFILLFAGTILYPYSEALLNKRTVYLTKAIIEGRPFLPNLVGETNYSLTRIARRAREGVQNHKFTFSPTLLQAWFYIHIGITGESFRREQFPDLLDRISGRARLPTRTFAGVRALFHSLEPEDFYQMAKCFDVDWGHHKFPGWRLHSRSSGSPGRLTTVRHGHAPVRGIPPGSEPHQLNHLIRST